MEQSFNNAISLHQQPELQQKMVIAQAIAPQMQETHKLHNYHLQAMTPERLETHLYIQMWLALHAIESYEQVLERDPGFLLQCSTAMLSEVCFVCCVWFFVLR